MSEVLIVRAHVLMAITDLAYSCVLATFTVGYFTSVSLAKLHVHVVLGSGEGGGGDELLVVGSEGGDGGLSSS